MRTVRFEEIIRQAAANERRMQDEMWFPEGTRTQRSWPVCMTCRQECDAAELKNFCMTSVEIWAKHHGKEDFYKVFFPFRIDGDPVEDDRANWALKRAMHDGVFFDPKEIKADQRPTESLLILPKTPTLAKGSPGIIL